MPPPRCKLCSEGMPDFILLDWNMPEISGLEFLIELRKMPHGAEPKVIFCTTENHQKKILQRYGGRCGRVHYETVQ